VTQPLPLSAKPHLPSAEAILAYLRHIDGNRWYSNFGPLVREFEARLEERFPSQPGSIVTVASGTAGLTLALQSFDIRPSVCLLPSWTFVASAAAVKNAGLIPYFIDVDPESWQLTPALVRRSLETVKEVGAVVVVAPFGAPVDLAAWAAVAHETNISVVVDSAAGFDTARAHPRLVSVVSLHATKVLGVGEGGFILAGTSDRADKLRRMSNFGLNSAHQSIYPATNAKLSEYAAAVGLAALDEWPKSRSDLLERAEAYRAQITSRKLFDDLDCPAEVHASTTFNIILRRPLADEVVAFMRRDGLGARKIWGEGCHGHPTFKDCACGDLAITDKLIRHVLALPFWIDMTNLEMASVADCLASFFHGRLANWDRPRKRQSAHSR
jgi:dTDP-4-amino-4,6-dideoxygalactose transaminase